jgi:hypothetical protein
LIVENVFEDAAYEQILEERGYRLWHRVSPNDVYVSAEWPQRPLRPDDLDLGKREDE